MKGMVHFTFRINDTSASRTRPNVPQSMSPFPENFTRLHQREEYLRARSVEAIKAADDLAMHAGVIASAMDLIDYFARHYVNETDDQLTIQLLGIRLFNGAPHHQGSQHPVPQAADMNVKGQRTKLL